MEGQSETERVKERPRDRESEPASGSEVGYVKLSSV